MSPVAKNEGPGSERTGGKRRFPSAVQVNPIGARRFRPDRQALDDALDAVRALDADSYQALLWALGLTPDERLSVPGARRSIEPSGRIGRGSTG
ncbi:MAG: hypothetical protein QOE27_1587 [Solirubrobacteraceae bacterium]|jgi:hypothetical protein|nr:hypothetical protein [Solirubrobacteraceae bacterium]